MVDNSITFFKKHFKFEFTDRHNISAPALTLINQQERESFIIERAKKFQNVSYYSDKENQLNLLKEITDMCDYDMKTATYDTSDINHWEGAENLANKNEIVYTYNLVAMLGALSYMILDKDGIRLNKIEASNPLPFSTAHMVKQAYTELLEARSLEYRIRDGLLPRNYPVTAYGATLIFSSIIEHELKLHTKIYYTRKFIKEIETKVSKDHIVLDEKEQHLINYNKKQRDLADSYNDPTTFDAHTATHERFYNLLVKYHLVKASDKDIKGIFEMGELTLNKLVQSKYFKRICDPRFQKTMNYVFGRNRLNLRNQLSHCSVKYFNYYNINVTALLYHLFFMISEEHFLLKE